MVKARAREERTDSSYELQRQERMSRNLGMLEQLKIEKTKSAIRKTVNAENQSKMSLPQRKRRRHGVRTAKVVSVVATRKSSRIRGGKPSSKHFGETVIRDDPDSGAKLLELEEYFKQNEMKVDPIKSDGRYRGWVKEEICIRYGIAGDPDKAWNENGGGKFTFKITKADIPQHLRSRGWSNARAFSSTQMLKNPNAYFYRHVAPHEAQSYGDWTEEEHNLFLDTARTYGVGDKWGLFASFIPRRVGYQCSAYYREVMIPNGFIVDPRFRLTQAGKAVFVGG